MVSEQQSLEQARSASQGGSSVLLRSSGSPFQLPYLRLTVALLLTVALTAFDGLAVLAAMPQIGAELGELHLYSWVVTAFLLTSTVAIPVAGPVVDELGVRTAFRWSLGVFVGASVACALAPTMTWLVAMRLLQGVGGGFAFAVSTTAVGVAYPAAWRARMYALISTVWGVLSLAAPALATLLVRQFDWTAVFWINLPLGAVVVWAGWYAMPTVERRCPTRPDWLGIGLIAGATSAALVGLSSLHPWALGAAFVLAAAYWLYSGRAPRAVLARRHLASAPFRALSWTAGGIFAALLGPIVYSPLYAQVGLQQTEAAAAWTVALYSVGWTSGAIVASRWIEHFRPDRIVFIATLSGAFVLVVSGMAISPEASLNGLLVASLVQGLCIGLVASVAFTLTQDCATSLEIGRATTAHQYVRSVGQTLGAGLSGAVLFTLVEREVGSAEPVRELLAGNAIDLGPAARAAVVEGVRWAHYAAAAIALITVPVAWRISREVPASRTPRVGRSASSKHLVSVAPRKSGR